MEWSSDVRQADWFRARLSPFDSGIATSVVPGGFDAYARIFHPASRDLDEDRVPVRWSEIAAWSGLSLVPNSQFADIALPASLPGSPRPWDSGPQEGTLATPYATALVDDLTTQSSALPWWFCVWEGFGWDGGVMGWAITDDSDIAATPAELEALRLEVEAWHKDPVPREVRDGPRARLPNRDYLFYRGDPGDALAFVESRQQTANLWWPSDHSWCVATEIDLPWTYVGGSSELIAAVVSDTRLEALVVSPDVNNWMTVPAWVTALAEQAAHLILRDGHAVLETPYGSVRATLATDETGSWRLTMDRRVEGELGSGSSWSSSSQTPSDDSLVRSLTRSVIELVP